MIATLLEPYESVKGTLCTEERYYARMVKGRCILQHKPNRKGHTATEREKANRIRFGQTYGTARKK